MLEFDPQFRDYLLQLGFAPFFGKKPAFVNVITHQNIRYSLFVEMVSDNKYKLVQTCAGQNETIKMLLFFGNEEYIKNYLLNIDSSITV